MMRRLSLMMMLASGCVYSQSGIGAPCSEKSPCPGALICDETLPDGYCTQPCTTLGSTSECLGRDDFSDAMCTVLNGALGCAATCGEVTLCRNGYSCRPYTGGTGIVMVVGVCLNP
ncbi:MAG: hypothetical protein JNG84_14380 [Archangium sp.]|nr:hypothetical protein [Archangium sp.]